MEQEQPLHEHFLQSHRPVAKMVLGLKLHRLLKIEKKGLTIKFNDWFNRNDWNRDYYFQTRKFGSVYLTVVSKLVISDQTWNAFMGTFTKDSDVEEFIDSMLNNQYDPDLLGIIGNNLPKFPDIVGVILMGESIYKD